MALLRPTLAYDDLRAADLVIEAVFEEMELKREVFATLDRVAKPGAILATNTSTLDVDKIAAATGRPQDVIGMHFFSPANVMKLLEVVRGKRDGRRRADDRDAAREARSGRPPWSRESATDSSATGWSSSTCGRRCSCWRRAHRRSRWTRALEAFGMAMGPFRMSDLAGNDVGWRIRKRRYVEKPHIVYSRIADRLCERGRFGQKTGNGLVPPTRRAGATAIPDPAVDALIAGYRAEIGIVPRTIDDAEIVGRCVLALVNEGARLLEEGIALRASDIDVVYLAGYGFPRYRGGPMFHADLIGLPRVVARMREFAGLPRADTAFWEPAPLLARLAAEGTTFTRERDRQVRMSQGHSPSGFILQAPAKLCPRARGYSRSEREIDVDRRRGNARPAGRKRAVGTEGLRGKVPDQACQIANRMPCRTRNAT